MRKLEAVRRGGSEEARARHVARGKLLVRERIRLLLDPDTPLLELSPLAAHDMYGGDVSSASLVTGVGRIAGATAWWSPTTPPSRAAPIIR